MKKLVKEICDVTYSLIDQFIEDIYYCVAEVLEITPEKCKSYTLEELNTVIQGKNLDEKVYNISFFNIITSILTSILFRFV